jgi:hypothetical protein
MAASLSRDFRPRAGILVGKSGAVFSHAKGKGPVFRRAGPPAIRYQAGGVFDGETA